MMNNLLRAFPAQEILDFWFGNATRDPIALGEQAKLWFTGSSALDTEIRRRFAEWFEPLSDVQAEEFESETQLLAAVILFDQFSRNCFRGEAKAFAYDVYALDLLDYALARSWDKKLHVLQCAFLYMPLQHIESLDGQALGIKLFEKLADTEQSAYTNILSSNADYARQHHALIARFGRFPHRNQVLGRASTTEETAYLASGGQRFGQ